MGVLVGLKVGAMVGLLVGAILGIAVGLAEAKLRAGNKFKNQAIRKHKN